eukprot:SAG22_NODE_7090_length_778_cov_1.010309_1_plen_68_part_00
MPATPGNATGLGGGTRNGKTPTHTIHDGTEEQVKAALAPFTDKQKLRDRKKLVYAEDKKTLIWHVPL